MTRSWLDDELEAVRAAGLLRCPRPIHSMQGPEIEIGGRTLLNFCGNDYLGLAADKRLIKAARTAAARWGAGSGSSRLISGNLEIFIKLERGLAKLAGCESALLFNSGYHANLGAISALAGKEDAIFSDHLNHASIIDGCRLSRARVHVYDHCDPDHLDKLLAKETGARRKLVITETVFSMDGDLAPLPAIIAAAKKHGAMVMVDEAHALGVLGGGEGALAHFGIPAGEVDAVMGTLGKALGSTGAFVGGSAVLIEYLINRARTFIYTTGPAPAAAGAALEALRVMGDEPWRSVRVLAHSDRVRAALVAMGKDSAPGEAAIVPVILGDPDRAMAACAALLERGVFAQGIRPPTVPKGTSRLRINLSAAHTDDQVEKLIRALEEVLA